MNQKTELQQAKKLFDALPRESYEDFILWLCMNFIDNPTHPADVATHPLYLTWDEYIDWVESYEQVKYVLDTLVIPLNGSVEDE